METAAAASTLDHVRLKALERLNFMFVTNFYTTFHIAVHISA